MKPPFFMRNSRDSAINNREKRHVESPPPVYPGLNKIQYASLHIAVCQLATGYFKSLNGAYVLQGF